MLFMIQEIVSLHNTKKNSKIKKGKALFFYSYIDKR